MNSLIDGGAPRRRRRHRGAARRRRGRRSTSARSRASRFVPLFVAWQGQRPRATAGYAFVAAAVYYALLDVVVVVLRHGRDRAARRRARARTGRRPALALGWLREPGRRRTRSSPPRCGCSPRRRWPGCRSAGSRGARSATRSTTSASAGRWRATAASSWSRSSPSRSTRSSPTPSSPRWNREAHDRRASWLRLAAGRGRGRRRARSWRSSRAASRTRPGRCGSRSCRATTRTVISRPAEEAARYLPNSHFALGGPRARAGRPRDVPGVEHGRRSAHRPVPPAAGWPRSPGAPHAWVLANAVADAPARGNEPAGAKALNLDVLFRPDGSVEGTYAKRHLVPFGEYVPFRSELAAAHRRAEPQSRATSRPGKHPGPVRDRTATRSRRSSASSRRSATRCDRSCTRAPR